MSLMAQDDTNQVRPVSMILNRFIDDYFGKVKEASYSEGPAGTPQGLGFLFG
jgi:hypothetical protein